MIEKILGVLSSNPRKAFVQLWLLFKTNYPEFQKAEQASLDDRDGHRELRETILNTILENEPLKILNLSTDFPLAFLEALDIYFSEYFHEHPNALRTRIQFKGAGYIIQQRVRRHIGIIRHEEQTGHLHPYLRRNSIIPENIEGISISIQKPRSIYFNKKNFLEKRNVKIYVGNFPDRVTPDWSEDHLPDYLAKGLADKGKRWNGLLKSLNDAARQGADIVVFPELTVCPELRARVSTWLDDNTHPFTLILPGSFHQKLNGAFFNFAELLGHTGVAMLSHKKLTTFGEKGKREKISTGNRIEIMDTPIGLIGIPICLDFCEEDSPFNTLWEEVGVDWLLVPAFGGKSSVHAHKRRAGALNRAHGSIIVLSNQNPESMDADHGFVYHDGADDEAKPENRLKSVGLKIVTKHAK